MKPSIQKLQKFFTLEADRGYDNHAVMGGLARMLEHWEAEARRDEIPEEIIQAVDRPAFGAHLDPVNITSSPRRFYFSGDFIRDCFCKLGPHIVSCHAKDVQMMRTGQVHFEETFAGNGGLDYQAYVSELVKIENDTPLMIEHCTPRQLVWARDYIVEQAAAIGVSMRHAELHES